MTNPLRLILVLHQHQPVGNLEAVNEEIYRDSYLPLLETLAEYPSLPINLHVSGSLVDWLSTRHPEYLHRVRELVTAHRVELLGGAYHDPILPMLSHTDRRGQIDMFGRRLGQLCGVRPRGMWLAERIWEPSIAADMAACDIEHTVLDDYHFHAAGLANDRLRGYYLTEAAGQLVALFAGDEQLRYLIPFAEPEESIAYLRGIANSHPGAVMVYADDAEKFGSWPGMHERVYQRQWLRRFLTALVANADWLRVTTLGETIDHVPPLGKVYVPEGSYREMDRWSTLAGTNSWSTRPASAGASHDNNVPAALESGRPQGTWRNFRVKYPEVDEMYCRMLAISRRCEAAMAETDEEPALAAIREAQQALYRAQCGCAYWHGIFGGVYMPHLRQAVYQNLIEAEKHLDAAADRSEPWLSATIDDFNLDVHKELQLANSKLSLFLAPEAGGSLYELDVRETGTNLLATLARRPEPYHPQIATTPAAGNELTNQPLLYDAYARRSLLDRFLDAHTTLDDVALARATERGDFLEGRYRARLRRTGEGVCAQLTRAGHVWGRGVTVTKEITLWAQRATMNVHYELAGLPPGQPFQFAIEFNFAGFPPDSADRYFVDAHNQVVADLGRCVDLPPAPSLRLVDRWQGLDVSLAVSELAGFWAFPICTASRSQRGIETIQQSVTVMPHWRIVGDATGRFAVDLQLSIVTSPSGVHPPLPLARPVPQQTVATAAPQAVDSTVRYVIDGPHEQIAPKSASATPTRYMYGL